MKKMFLGYDTNAETPLIQCFAKNNASIKPALLKPN